MPSKAFAFVKKKKTFNKKSFKKKRIVKIKNSGSVGKELAFGLKSPLPVKFHAKLRYSECYSLAVGTAGVTGTQQLMFLNSAYDPNNTGGGHSSMGLDELMALYTRYKVNRVKVTLIWSNIGASGEVVVLYKINPNGSATTLTGMTIDLATELPSVSTAYLSSTGNQRIVEQNFWVDIPKVLGLSASAYEDESFYNTSTGSPLRTVNLYLGVCSPNGTSGTAVTCQVIIEQQCVFKDRIDLPQS